MDIRLNSTKRNEFQVGDVLAVKDIEEGTGKIYYKLVIDLCDDIFLLDLQDCVALIYRDDWEEFFGEDELVEIIPSSELMITRKND